MNPAGNQTKNVSFRQGMKEIDCPGVQFGVQKHIWNPRCTDKKTMNKNRTYSRKSLWMLIKRSQNTENEGKEISDETLENVIVVKGNKRLVNQAKVGEEILSSTMAYNAKHTIQQSFRKKRHA